MRCTVIRCGTGQRRGCQLRDMHVQVWPKGAAWSHLPVRTPPCEREKVKNIVNFEFSLVLLSFTSPSSLSILEAVTQYLLVEDGQCQFFRETFLLDLEVRLWCGGHKNAICLVISYLTRCCGSGSDISRFVGLLQRSPPKRITRSVMRVLNPFSFGPSFCLWGQ